MDVYRELFMKQVKKASRDFFVFFSLFFSELIKNYLNKLFDEIIGKGELKLLRLRCVDLPVCWTRSSAIYSMLCLSFEFIERDEHSRVYWAKKRQTRQTICAIDIWWCLVEDVMATWSAIRQKRVKNHSLDIELTPCVSCPIKTLFSRTSPTHFRCSPPAQIARSSTFKWAGRIWFDYHASFNDKIDVTVCDGFWNGREKHVIEWTILSST